MEESEEWMRASQAITGMSELCNPKLVRLAQVPHSDRYLRGTPNWLGADGSKTTTTWENLETETH